MVRKRDVMRGILLNPRSGQVYINESYEKFLKTMYGRKFPHSFVAMLNDLLDSGIIETLDDMKKVIRFFEWRIDTKERAITNLIRYNSDLLSSLKKVKGYAERMEERFAEAKAKVEELEEWIKIKEKVGEEALVKKRRSASDILARLRGEAPAIEAVEAVAAAGADIRAEGEIAAGDVEGELEPVLHRPREMAEEVRDGAKAISMGPRLEEAEIGADDLDFSPEIMKIVDKIEKVKDMEALHSDEEIERIFEGQENKKKGD